MPSYLADDALPDFTSNFDQLQLDPQNRFGLTSKKDITNVGSVNSEQTHHISESIDDRSTLSTAHESDASGATPTTMNGGSNGTQSTGKTSTNRTSHTSYNDEKVASDKIGNGTTMVFPDRTVQSTTDALPSPPNDTTQFPLAPATNGQDYASDANNTTTRDSVTPSASDILVPNSQSASLAPPKPGPHRFSSPPAYHSGNSAVKSSPSGHLLPPEQLQPPVLKQRHTLDVSKPAASRTSKDGLDSAQSTGRFSPTTVPSGNRRTSMNLGRRSARMSNADMPRDEVAPDEDALRWAEAYRQKRASKRRKKEEEDDDRVLVGTKVDESHANWVTAYNMLTGIRVSVSRTNAKLDRELTDADFEAKQKSTFDITGNELVPSAKYDFKFKDYAPWVFRRLRALFRLDPADYLMSLTGKYILSELGSPGKSGSFFYFSRDYKYIIKTIHHAEHKFLRKVLKDYYTHVQENPNTLLSQFYGLHRVKMPYGKKIHFVVMNNLFPPHRDIHTTFDLKGSTVGRNYREEDLENNPRATLKDLNWLRRQRNLELGIQKKRLFLEQLQKDVALLKRLQIMDYSLLVGIHDLSRGNDENLRDKTLRVFNPGGDKSAEEEPQPNLYRTPSKLETARKARELRQMIRQERPIPIGQAIDKMPDELGESHSRPGFVFNQDDGGFQATHENNAPADEIYYLGVIDCLTHYGVIKKIEHFWKGLSNDRTQISALPPDQYGDRFYNFVEGVTMSHEEAQREALRREQEQMEAVRQSMDKTHRHKEKQKLAIPPMPTHQPPAPPGHPSKEARETVDLANAEAEKLDADAVHTGQHVPDRTLGTVGTLDARDGQRDSILPVVEEAGEGNRDEASSDSTPVNTSPTRGRLSRESLDKKLPPLPPNDDSKQESGVRIVA